MKRKVLILIAGIACTACINSSVVYAQECDYATEKETVEVVTRGDVIVTKYRVHDGYYQYRHWNATQGYWVEDDWITLA